MRRYGKTETGFHTARIAFNRLIYKVADIREFNDFFIKLVYLPIVETHHQAF